MPGAKRRRSPARTDEGAGAYEGPWRDGYAASRLLVPEVFNVDPVRGERLIFAPHVNRVWLVGSEDEAGMTAVLDAIDAYLASSEAATPYQWLLARWIAALETDLERRRKASAAKTGASTRA